MLLHCVSVHRFCTCMFILFFLVLEILVFAYFPVRGLPSYGCFPGSQKSQQEATILSPPDTSPQSSAQCLVMSGSVPPEPSFVLMSWEWISEARPCTEAVTVIPSTPYGYWQGFLLVLSLQDGVCWGHNDSYIFLCSEKDSSLRPESALYCKDTVPSKKYSTITHCSGLQY